MINKYYKYFDKHEIKKIKIFGMYSIQISVVFLKRKEQTPKVVLLAFRRTTRNTSGSFMNNRGRKGKERRTLLQAI